MKYFTRVGDLCSEWRFERRGDALLAHDGGRTLAVDVSATGDGNAFALLVDGKSYDVFVEPANGAMLVVVQGERIEVEVEDERERVAHALHVGKPGGRCEVRAVMPGIVVAIHVSVGMQVAQGQALLVLEAMKMQNPMSADAAGVVTKVHAQSGVAVAAGALLIEIDAAP